MLKNLEMICNLLVACTCFLGLLSPCVSAAQPTEQKIQVYLLTGQSNMEGKGNAAHLETYQADPLIKDTYLTLKQNGQWVERHDVSRQLA